MVNGHTGFDGFGTMTNWRKSGASCNPLCADQGCSTRTFDYFGELDSSCVGGAPGLMGFQLRSYPVSYYGFYPAVGERVVRVTRRRHRAWCSLAVLPRDRDTCTWVRTMWGIPTARCVPAPMEASWGVPSTW